MVNHRKPVPQTSKVRRRLLCSQLVLKHSQSFRQDLRVLHYSTSRPSARFAIAPTVVEHSRSNALRYPLVESMYPDADRQPWIHDFDVRLEHGRKLAHFRIFLKRGLKLTPNSHAADVVGDIVIMRLDARDGVSVVNARSTDLLVADYVFNGSASPTSGFHIADCSAGRSSASENFRVLAVLACPRSSSSSALRRSEVDTICYIYMPPVVVVLCILLCLLVH